MGRSCPHSVLHIQLRGWNHFCSDCLLNPDNPRDPPQDLFSLLMSLLVSLPGGIPDMAWVLLLLLPTACLQAGNTAESNREKLYGFGQPTRISGVQGRSIEIPFFFYFPWELAKDPQMRIFWRWQHYHGEYIYNSSSGFIHEHFKDRLILNWTQPQTSGVLRILNLKEKDQTVYFCRVHLKTTKAVRTITKSPSIVTSAVTTAGLEDTEGQKNPSLVSLGATIGVVVATALLITPVYVMLIFLRWKKRHKTICSSPADRTPGASIAHQGGEFPSKRDWWPHILHLKPFPHHGL
ncbi:paired immunoglobulin-like type 2 receptor beta isoform X3 [Microtus pennsylvanicus]|uniref:paired immunoglobulin-like type 2 receptor beta isoform X3 n=1 Tax=Microtus pennsylvanicus TaxID=10058 RepID=UPI003F6C3C8E